ncbi:hypothetical protein CLU84_3440 [Comamonas sp. 26]|nr:hypothetical protein CLU84_3440 [Comamonas sp. 26]
MRSIIGTIEGTPGFIRIAYVKSHGTNANTGLSPCCKCRLPLDQPQAQARGTKQGPHCSEAVITFPRSERVGRRKAPQG